MQGSQQRWIKTLRMFCNAGAPQNEFAHGFICKAPIVEMSVWITTSRHHREGDCNTTRRSKKDSNRLKGDLRPLNLITLERRHKLGLRLRNLMLVNSHAITKVPLCFQPTYFPLYTVSPFGIHSGTLEHQPAALQTQRRYGGGRQNMRRRGPLPFSNQGGEAKRRDGNEREERWGESEEEEKTEVKDCLKSNLEGRHRGEVEGQMRAREEQREHRRTDEKY